MQVTDAPLSNNHSEVPPLVVTLINGLVWAVCHTAVQQAVITARTLEKKFSFGFKSTDETLPTCLCSGVMTFDAS
jgi:hypothetical protein